ncbi:MAG: Plug domain-containing protein [Bacteroides graminisolvens]
MQQNDEKDESICIFGSLVFPSYLLAAVTVPDSTSRKSVMLDEVVVTSYKEKKTLREVPASVSLISLGDLNKKNLVDFKELSSYIPNLFLPDYGSKLTSPIYIRGIGSKLTPSVGLYVDGIPFFDKSVFDFDMNEVNRVEVLRGLKVRFTDEIPWEELSMYIPKIHSIIKD